MSLRAGMCGFVLLGVLIARADEPAAPLENSKQELKALQKDKAAQAGEGSVGKLREAMPRLQAPGSTVPPVEAPAPQPSESAQHRKNMEAQKNWLLDGMDRLEKTKNRNSADKRDEAKDEQAAPNDPNYLLNLYGEQQKDAEAKTEARQSPAGHKDPLTPFLQSWLADSPVRGKFFDEYIKKPDYGASSGGTMSQTFQQTGGESSSLAGPESGLADLHQTQGGTVPVTANPYLQSLDLPALQGKGAPERQPAMAAGFQPLANQPPAPLAEPGPTAVQVEKKLQLPGLTDDNKYFPQLKKF